MHLSRAIPVLAAALLSLASVGSVIAADTHGPDRKAGRITGLIQPGHPRIDPNMPWLVGAVWPADGSYRLVDGGRTLGDSISPWPPRDKATLDRQQRGAQYAGTVAWSDPRFVGWMTMTWNRDIYVTAGATASVDVISLRLDGNGGSWVGNLTGQGEPVEGSFRIAGTLTGTDRYDGLTTVLAIVGSGGVDDSWTIDGLVFAGPMPPVG